MAVARPSHGARRTARGARVELSCEAVARRVVATSTAAASAASATSASATSTSAATSDAAAAALPGRVRAAQLPGPPAAKDGPAAVQPPCYRRSVTAVTNDDAGTSEHGDGAGAGRAGVRKWRENFERRLRYAPTLPPRKSSCGLRSTLRCCGG